MRGAYGFDRESGKDILEFSTKLGNPTTEIQIDLSKINDDLDKRSDQPMTLGENFQWCWRGLKGNIYQILWIRFDKNNDLLVFSYRDLDDMANDIHSGAGRMVKDVCYK